MCISPSHNLLTYKQPILQVPTQQIAPHSQPHLVHSPEKKRYAQSHIDFQTLTCHSSNNNPEKVTLQLVPKHRLFADTLKTGGHNPKLQYGASYFYPPHFIDNCPNRLQFKSVKTISFVINHLTNKWTNQTNNNNGVKVLD